MRIAFITDGSPQLGLGNVYQSITLANALAEKLSHNGEIFFLTQSHDDIVKQIRQAGLAVSKVCNDGEIFDILNAKRPDRVVIDKLYVSPGFAKSIKETINARLAIFTNLTSANQYADVTVHADIGSNFKNIYEKDEITGNTHFFGPKYWLLRPEFFKYDRKKKDPLLSVRNILLLFGAADPANLTTLVLDKLLHLDSDFEIMAVLGAAFTHQEELKAVLARHGFTRSTFQIVQNISNVAETMHNADVVFASPGLSFFEALFVGTPVVGFHQDELQRDVYKGYLPTIDKNDLSGLASLIEKRSFIFPDDPFIVSMEIGRGKDEIIQEILI